VSVLTIGIAWLWLREVPTVLTLVRGGIVMSGVLLVNARRRTEGRPRPEP
jgi:drug/metabolite transporter (DMT)-like permease